VRALLIVGIVGALALAAAAQTRPAQDAGAVVRSIEARYQSARTLQATFLERYSAGRNTLRIESGTAFFSRPGRMRWEYEEPEKKLFLVDGKTVWFYVPADRTATRAKIRESGDWQTPLALLTGNAKLSRFCHRIELADVRVTAAGNTALRCLPRVRQRGSADTLRVEEPPFREILLEVDATHRLVRILVRQAGDIETEFRFASWRENQPLPEHMFHFAAPAGVAIVEESSLAGADRP
jgi:outer membrane lipoprotein carrier protein